MLNILNLKKEKKKEMKKNNMCSSCKKKVIHHLKGDIKDFKKESNEDKQLIKQLNKSEKHVTKDKDPKPRDKKSAKIKVVMEEFKEGKLHSGSKTGPMVTNPKQAIAIAISESKRKRKK
jgi:hypothetical protein